MVRTLPRHSLESYTVTADSFYPGFLAVSFVSLLCIPTPCGAFELTSLQFSPLQRFSKLPVSTACCSDSISYVRVRCFIVVQRTGVWEYLCNYCATRI